MHKFCGYCGKKLSPNCNFCVNCGAKLIEYHEISKDSGGSNEAKDNTCEVCKGKGKLVCEECKGSGNCFMCLGSGICVWCSDLSSCEYCQDSKICMICKGLGKCKNCEGKKYLVCPECEGSGIIEPETKEKTESELLVEQILNRNV
jgi:hypothetical protein